MESLKNEFNKVEEDNKQMLRRRSTLTRRSDNICLEEILNSNYSADSNKKIINSNFMKIDEKNNFLAEKNEIIDLSEKYNIDKNKLYDKLNTIINKIFNRACGTSISYSDDIFLISQNISKIISKIIKMDKKYIDQLIKELVGLNYSNNHEDEILCLNKRNCEIIGSFLCYSYSDSRLQQYKIKDSKKLIEIRKLIIKQGINVYRDYMEYCRNNKITDLKTTFYWKKKRNQYDCLPELIFLFNRFSKVKEIEFDINSFIKENDSDIDEANKLLTYLTLININLILNSNERYKINIIYQDFENNLYFKYYNYILNSLFKNNSDFSKINNRAFKNKNFIPKWDFNYSINMNHHNNIGKNNENLEKIPLSIDTDKESSFEEEENNLKSNSKVLELSDIIENYYDNFEFIIICFYGLIYLNNDENFELTFITNDIFTNEFQSFLYKVYSIEDKNSISIFDILLCKKNRLRKKFNIEINSLDYTSFEKTLYFLMKNKFLNSFNISLFSSDITYFPQSLYKIYSTNENTFNDTNDLEKNILNKLSENFIYNLSSLFDILKYMTNLEEFGININIPPNLINLQNYKNSILKFILNLLFYFSFNTKIKRFCLLSPQCILDSRRIPYINNIIKNININKATNLIDLTLNLQFLQISKIGKLISTRLQVLNIGYLDFETFKKICFFLCNDNFNKQSCLMKLSIGLLNIVMNFDIELKLLIRKLFSIKIKSLTSLSLYTNIIIKDEIEYDYLLNILNNNWINEYLITLNTNSEKYFHNFEKDKLNLKFFVPHSLEEKLIEPKDIIKYQNNPASLEISKNLDKNDDSYWYLKYLFENRYNNILNNDNRVRNIILGILKYLYFQKMPTIKYFSRNN